ncbi:MAG: hypothetical protein EBS06_08315 [Proteobacteria bacterium]|nr:hypothetical protein [Pseudomonadota bacterium]
MTNEIIHEIFADRPLGNAKLWRYLSLSKLISLLESRSLHFTRIDKFDDHFEGVWPLEDLKQLNKLKGANIPSYTEFVKQNQIAACCWIKNEYESVAMWKLYSNHEGLAITSTYEQLDNSLKDSQTLDGIGLFGVGKVKYVDHVKDSLVRTSEPLPNTLRPFMIKNISYEHEKEVRALAMSEFNFTISEYGLDIKVNLDHLINDIVINPLASDHYISTTRKLLEKYQMESKLRISSLSKLSFYQKVISNNPKYQFGRHVKVGGEE